ncbi:Nickel-responsive regulator [Rhodovastum atsumiense]|uniref:Putative nickel-responsive regulator n=1 Tax=Rhodovastum atsumiense TaxID=504468 RepID=A0A5M6IWZ7_9PROT|nr:nickel-responsive transcriptional regulator NikR [Rhodovastum atsumiense]KAA5612854.1 nickel-responsive transcriptional regulator NikR [Rhodovastum atsumiense]CAH2601078.1 Nickel-responsive regulator [Rhodovastum atsumiense]
MERITISLERPLLEAFDAHIRRKGYENRSEAIRDLLRHLLERDRVAENRAEHAVACLSYIYNHHQRELSRRLTETQHAHHDLVLSTLHVHLDHDNCLEVAILKGMTAALRHFAEDTMAETGVRHGNLHLVPVEVVRTHIRTEDGHDHPHEHLHTHPAT